MSLSKEQFLAGRKLAISEPIRLPGREDDTFVRELTGGEKKILDDRRFRMSREGMLILDVAGDDVNWVTACACDSAGNLLFDWKDIEAVRRMPALDLAIVAKEALALNRTGTAAVEAEAKKLLNQPDVLFAHRLAKDIGEWDVDGLLAAIGTGQLVRWQAYYLLEPWLWSKPKRPPLHLVSGRGRRFLTAAEIQQRIREANENSEGSGG